jgi:(p)ppGpp synthase/HD superfamily hydrolase
VRQLYCRTRKEVAVQLPPQREWFIHCANINNGINMQFSTRFCEAFSYAASLHAEQRRKVSGEPYMAHLMAVASLVLEHGGNEDEAIAALLHDAVEDQGGVPTFVETGRRFGNAVAQIVDGCTDANVTPKPPWRQRKETYIAKLPAASASVRLVSAADKLHNARSILRDYRQNGEAVWSHFRGGREGTLWYFRAVVDALQSAGANALVEELDRTVAEIERMAGPSC